MQEMFGAFESNHTKDAEIRASEFHVGRFIIAVVTSIENIIAHTVLSWTTLLYLGIEDSCGRFSRGDGRHAASSSDVIGCNFDF